VSKIYDANGLEKQAVISVAWGDIIGIPARVQELSVLVDPNSEFYYVGWDDVANELRMRIFDPLNIPYDNGASGLSATNVQDAIDELAALVAALVSGNVYPGYVGSDGTTGNRLPVGWSATRTGAGTYEVTHSLGLTDLTRLAVSPGCIGSAGNKAIQQRSSGTGNKFVIETVDSGTGTLTDEAFSFTAKLT
jgi:hypothetical protein